MDSLMLAEQALRDYAGVRPPFDTKGKKRALQFVLDHKEDFFRFAALGYDAIPGEPWVREKKRGIIESYFKEIRELPPRAELHFNIWLMAEAMGMGNRAPGRFVFYRCSSCHEVRTYKNVQTGFCGKCGGTEVTDRVKTVNTKELLKLLLLGR